MIPLIYVIKAITTSYSPVETCPRGKIENCVNAQGKIPITGLSIACPRHIPLGTPVLIQKKLYRCDDRTALTFDGRFDMFTQSYDEAKKYGKQEQEIVIFNLFN